MHFKLYAFHLIFNHILDSHTPIKDVKIRSRPNSYVTDGIISLMKTRDNRRKLARKTNDPLAWAAYKNFNRKVKRQLRFAGQEYVELQIRNNPSNTGCIWKTIRACITIKSASCKAYSKDDKVVADDFNEFFTSIGQTTVGKIKGLAQQSNYDITK